MEMNDHHDWHCICPSNLLLHGTRMAGSRAKEAQELNKILDIRSKVIIHVHVMQYIRARDQCCHM
jgi:hypothetical protein